MGTRPPELGELIWYYFCSVRNSVLNATAEFELGDFELLMKEMECGELDSFLRNFCLKYSFKRADIDVSDVSWALQQLKFGVNIEGYIQRNLVKLPTN